LGLTLIAAGFYSQKAEAITAGDVIINEVAWMGSEIKDVESKSRWRYEWLELYNNASSPINLNGWAIELYRVELDWSLNLSGEIPAYGYFLIASSEKIAGYDLNYSNLAGKFNNNGQKIALRDDAENVVDEVDCFSSKKWFAGDNKTKQTMERVALASSESNPTNWQSSQSPGGTPKLKNSAGAMVQETKEVRAETESALIVATQADFISGVVLNEILPNPDGPDNQEEWIELFNQNNFEVDITGWSIQDDSGKTYVLPASTIIAPNQFLVLKRSQTKITLNNNEEQLVLTASNGEIANEIGYLSAPKGKSFNLTGEKWLWSRFLTPGDANQTDNPETELKTSLSPEDRNGKQLAAAGVQVANTKNFFFVLAIALLVAIVSGALILVLKKVSTR